MVMKYELRDYIKNNKPKQSDSFLCFEGVLRGHAVNAL